VVEGQRKREREEREGAINGGGWREGAINEGVWRAK
jgi:hypothetical protein